ncbi:protein deacetylase [Aureococcus anophagefferens]|uniref:Protein deacetylase n=1 Tax=Aureococcus anophagefferens TaxID=44056 RepID=A0ABR1G9U9_AURAN
MLRRTCALLAVRRARGLATRPVFYYNDVWEFPLPENHRFPMAKYRLVREALQAEGVAAAFEPSPLASLTDLTTTHCRGYCERFVGGKLTAAENRNIGFPWSPAAPTALGFCVFSDIAVAANVLLRDYGDVVEKILVVDVDVHQGNGNAKLFEGAPAVTTFSMHCDGNYFSEKRASDVDVEVPAGAGDGEYLRLLKSYVQMLAGGGADVVFLQAGVDPSEHDRLGKLRLTADGLRRRNKLLLDAFLRKGASVVVTMGGGYPKNLDPAGEREA